FVRAYAYIRELGAEGLKKVSEMAVLNANYIRASLAEDYHLPYAKTCMHECVFSDKRQNKLGVKTMDIAKRLMDYGFHPSTIYFPLIVSGALMIEPTETEDKETIDAFIAAMKSISREVVENPQIVTDSPHITGISRPDEVEAARKPVLRWKA
ncbi:MAG: aminomethyl-transferring glycine dehydrogenase subunit GcvPB, partial [Deltaproteobacteria bacterium]|nr:aminomethyl-transferring glycine dehydrogenase subunit GcvPB [Deltaproteobacteria bacterium]